MKIDSSAHAPKLTRDKRPHGEVLPVWQGLASILLASSLVLLLVAGCTNAPASRAVQPSATSTPPSVVIDAGTLLGTSVEEVELKLGTPSQVEKFGPGGLDSLPYSGESRYYTFKNETIYIDYYNDMAVGISVGSEVFGHAYAFSDWRLSLQQLGFTVTAEPDTSTVDMKRWANYEGYSIRIYAENGQISIVQIWKAH